MRIVLVGPSQEENLSLRYLASSLEGAGHEVVLAPFNSVRDAAQVLELATGCDMAGLSLSFQVRAREFLALAAQLKARQVPLVVAGGHYASCAAEELLRHHPALDAVVIHEGERSLVEMADAGGPTQAIAGIVFRRGDAVARTAARPIAKDLDALPFPDRRGPAQLYAGVPTAHLLGSRGCISHCDYCCIMTLHRLAPGPRLRRRDPERIADEMAQLYHERGIRQFIFNDDNFLVPSARTNLERLAALESAWSRRRVKDIGLVVKCRPADLSPEVLARLSAMGLVRVFLGVESASDRGLRAMGREQQVPQAERAVELCLERGISLQYTLMCFHPDATVATLRADLDFMRRHDDCALNWCRTEIYAGTPLEHRMVEEGRASGDYLARTYSIADPAADRVCRHAMRIFHDRCWSQGGLMETAIGLDHLVGVLGRFYSGPRAEALRREIHEWRLVVNRQLVGQLATLVDSCEAGTPAETDLRELELLERRTRQTELETARQLRRAIDALVEAEVGVPVAPVARSGMGAVARHAAAAALAIATAGGFACFYGACEYAAPPLDSGYHASPDAGPDNPDGGVRDGG